MLTIGPGKTCMPQRPAIRTRDMLVTAMALIIVCATFASLFVVRHRLEHEVTGSLSADLMHSVTTFENLQAQKLSALERENALLADLPSLKALMTTSDERTIQNGAVEFWKVSGNDLFALANADEHVVAIDVNGSREYSSLRAGLEVLLTEPARHYLVSGGRLFACSVQPLYFGSEENGTLLGYVISGYAIDRNIVEQFSQATTVEATFATRGHAISSTLPPAVQTALMTLPMPLPEGIPPTQLTLVDEQYLAVTKDLSASASAPLQLIVLKSFARAERSIRQIDHLVLMAGFLAMILGTLLMLALSRLVTHPLEELAAGVHAFGTGDSTHRLPHRGTREVKELSESFASMRNEIQQAHRALLESERLATIGRMASSVSHDLRHYLAAVYANAEFLASTGLSEAERAEIFADIRTAVQGTTELLESLLIFSRTGTSIRRSQELLATVLERAITMVHAHPDAATVTLISQYDNARETAAIFDGKQIERAIYNLLLNACQSVRASAEAAYVIATIHVNDEVVSLEVKDNGAGVPGGIRKTLFEPFVSEGKQKGTGLGLTMAHCIAVEHGGEVVLVSSRPGETIFRMSLSRGPLEQATHAEEDGKKAVAG